MCKNTDVDMVTVERADYFYKIIVTTMISGRALPPAVSQPARWPSVRSFWTSPVLPHPARTHPE